jgi:hypothetical protein
MKKRFSSALSYSTKLKQSGRFDIDRFLDETKSNSNSSTSTATITDNIKSPLKWIPYNEFSNIKGIGKGGFGDVYEAIWHDAPEQKIDLIWNKKRVALKVLHNSASGDQSTDFLDEVNTKEKKKFFYFYFYFYFFFLFLLFIFNYCI